MTWIKNPIRLFAVLCVAVTSGYVMWMGYRVNETLSGPGWCATALGAGKASSPGGAPVKGLEACVGLLTIQLNSISTNSHILLGVIALCLLTLIVIVIAGGKLSLDASATGVKADISTDDSPVVTTTTTTAVTPPPPPPSPPVGAPA